MLGWKQSSATKAWSGPRTWGGSVILRSDTLDSSPTETIISVKYVSKTSEEMGSETYVLRNPPEA